MKWTEDELKFINEFVIQDSANLFESILIDFNDVSECFDINMREVLTFLQANPGFIEKLKELKIS